MNDWDREPARIVADPTVYARFCRLNILLFSQADPRDKEAALIEFFGECDEARGLRFDAPAISPRLSEQIQPVRDFLPDGPARGPTLSDQIGSASRGDQVCQYV